MNISALQIKTFLNCRRKYFYSYRERIKAKLTYDYLTDGKVIHSTLNKFYLDKECFATKPIPVGYEIFKQYGVEERYLGFVQFAYEEFGSPLEVSRGLARVLGMVGAYTKLHSPNEFASYEGEREFKVKFGEDYIVGRMDGVVSDHDGCNFVLEHKATADSGGLSFIEKEEDDAQTLLYLLVRYIETGEIPDGILYSHLRKDKYRLSSLDKDEDEFNRRIIKDYLLYPASYLMRFKVYKNIDDISWFQEELEQVIADIKVEKKIWVRNTERCFDYHGQCEYYALCQKKEINKGVVEDYFIKKEEEKNVF